MRKKIVALSLVVTAAVFLMTVYAEACYSDMDCGIGGDCIKVNDSMYGTCTN